MFVTIFAIVVLVCCYIGARYRAQTAKTEAQLEQTEADLQESYRVDEEGEGSVVLGGGAGKLRDMNYVPRASTASVSFDQS